MRQLIKYLVVLITLLLVGYTQVFAHLNRGNAGSSVKKFNATTYVYTLALNDLRMEDIYVEEEEVEEDDRLTVKKHSADHSFFSFPNAGSIYQKNVSYSHVSKSFSSYPSFQSPYLLFRVFRL